MELEKNIQQLSMQNISGTIQQQKLIEFIKMRQDMRKKFQEE